MIDKYQENRPWGDFEQFCLNQQCTVKFLNVNPNSLLSYQYHDHRDEFWRVVSGSGFVIIGEQKIECKPGDEFHIPVGTKHRIGTTDSALTILELSFGEFDENDITRLEDNYNRI